MKRLAPGVMKNSTHCLITQQYRKAQNEHIGWSLPDKKQKNHVIPMDWLTFLKYYTTEEFFGTYIVVNKLTANQKNKTEDLESSHKRGDLKTKRGKIPKGGQS